MRRSVNLSTTYSGLLLRLIARVCNGNSDHSPKVILWEGSFLNDYVVTAVAYTDRYLNISRDDMIWPWFHQQDLKEEIAGQFWLQDFLIQ